MKKIRLKKFYARNKYRDNDDNSLFKAIYKNLSFFSNTGWIILLAPTVMVSSLLTQTAFLMIANIFLALGFIFNFCHRIYLDEVGYFEFIMTLAIVAALILLAFYLAPAMPSTSLIGILCFVNLFSSSINSFFLIRNILLPPLASLTQSVLNTLGYSISIQFFYIHPLEIERDRIIIDRLLNKFYKYDSYSEKYKSQDLIAFNKLIVMVCRYINKYQESFLGYINRQEDIKKLENAVTKLVKEGNTESSIEFIRRKIAFKESKVKELKRVRVLVETTTTTQEFRQKNMHQFFTFLQKKDENNPKTINYCLKLLDHEIDRQENKLKDLYDCDPRYTLEI